MFLIFVVAVSKYVLHLFFLKYVLSINLDMEGKLVMAGKVLVFPGGLRCTGAVLGKHFVKWPLDFANTTRERHCIHPHFDTVIPFD